MRDESCWLEQTHKEQETFVLPDGSAAAQKAQQEQHAAHGQDDVDPGKHQGVCRHNLPEAHWVQQHPHANTQQEGATELGDRGLIIQSEWQLLYFRCLLWYSYCKHGFRFPDHAGEIVSGLDKD